MSSPAIERKLAAIMFTDIEFEVKFRLYQLLDDTSCLETAYKQIQEKASSMENELAKKFLKLTIPKQIVEEWKKIQ